MEEEEFISYHDPQREQKLRARALREEQRRIAALPAQSKPMVNKEYKPGEYSNPLANAPENIQTKSEYNFDQQDTIREPSKRFESNERKPSSAVPKQETSSSKDSTVQLKLLQILFPKMSNDTANHIGNLSKASEESPAKGYPLNLQLLFWASVHALGYSQSTITKLIWIDVLEMAKRSAKFEEWGYCEPWLPDDIKEEQQKRKHRYSNELLGKIGNNTGPMNEPSSSQRAEYQANSGRPVPVVKLPTVVPDASQPKVKKNVKRIVLPPNPFYAPDYSPGW
ncbi:hypothetical protein EDC01DRAFT_749902 [Geopyxis carbonaria]|nr:hypothetical protein EDC01DRAFT_749902 [Geopyxis carbonaria]